MFTRFSQSSKDSPSFFAIGSSAMYAWLASSSTPPDTVPTRLMNPETILPAVFTIVRGTLLHPALSFSPPSVAGRFPATYARASRISSGVFASLRMRFTCQSASPASAAISARSSIFALSSYLRATFCRPTPMPKGDIEGSAPSSSQCFSFSFFATSLSMSRFASFSISVILSGAVRFLCS